MFSRTLVANYLGRLIVSALSILLVPIYVGLFGLADYGVIGLFLAFQGLLSLLELGLGTSIARHLLTSPPADGAQMARAAERIVVLISVAAAGVGVMMALFTPLSTSLHQHTTPLAFALMLTAITVRLPIIVYSNILIGRERQISLNILLVISEVARNIACLAAIYFTTANRLEYFFGTNLCIGILSAVAYRIYSFRGIGEASPTKIGHAYPLMSFAGKMILVTASWLLIGNLDKIVLPSSLSAKEFGAYVVAYQLATGLFALYYPVFQSFYPPITKSLAEGRHDDIRHLLASSTAVMSSIISAMLVGTVAFREPLISIWLQDAEKARVVSIIAGPLMLAYLANGIWQLPYAIMIARGKMAFVLAVNLAWVLCMPFVLTVAARSGGGAAAAWAWGAPFFFYAAIATPALLHHLFRTSLAQSFMSNCAGPLFWALGVYAIVAHTGLPQSSLAVLIIAGGSMAAVAIVNMIVHPAGRELLSSLLTKPNLETPAT